MKIPRFPRVCNDRREIFEESTTEQRLHQTIGNMSQGLSVVPLDHLSNNCLQSNWETAIRMAGNQQTTSSSTGLRLSSRKRKKLASHIASNATKQQLSMVKTLTKGAYSRFGVVPY